MDMFFPSYTLELVLTAGSPQKKWRMLTAPNQNYEGLVFRWFLLFQFLVDFSVVFSRWLMNCGSVLPPGVASLCRSSTTRGWFFSVRIFGRRRKRDDVDVFDIKKQVVFMYFWFFTPKIAEMIPNLTHIFFRWVGEKPPTGCFIGNRIYTPKNWNGTWKCLRKEKEKHLHTTNFGVPRKCLRVYTPWN